MSVFEISMLVCFGVSWPISIYKSIKTKVVTGKSPLFLGIVILGYISGMLHKIFFSMDAVIWLYAANLFLVSVDLGLYFYYAKRNAGWAQFPRDQVRGK
jgi:hypothetical protein